MPDLAAALDAALRARYRISEVRTPVTQRRGLLARMNQLEKLFRRPGDTPVQTRRRAAEAAGIPDRTWRDWRAGTHPPSPASRRRLERAYNREVTLPAFRRAIKAQGIPRRVRVTATIKWTDSPRKNYNATPYRATTLTGMGPAMAATIKAWVGAGPEAAADAFQRGVSAAYKAPDDGDKPGIEFQGDDVKVEFP